MDCKYYLANHLLSVVLSSPCFLGQTTQPVCVRMRDRYVGCPDGCFNTSMWCCNLNRELGLANVEIHLWSTWHKMGRTSSIMLDDQIFSWTVQMAFEKKTPHKSCKFWTVRTLLSFMMAILTLTPLSPLVIPGRRRLLSCALPPPLPGLVGWLERVNGADEPPSPPGWPPPLPPPPSLPQWTHECPRPAVFPISCGFPQPDPPPLAAAS